MRKGRKDPKPGDVFVANHAHVWKNRPRDLVRDSDLWDVPRAYVGYACDGDLVFVVDHDSAHREVLGLTSQGLLGWMDLRRLHER